jgi:hypothetical protein
MSMKMLIGSYSIVVGASRAIAYDANKAIVNRETT